MQVLPETQVVEPVQSIPPLSKKYQLNACPSCSRETHHCPHFATVPPALDVVVVAALVVVVVALDVLVDEEATVEEVTVPPKRLITLV